MVRNRMFLLPMRVNNLDVYPMMLVSCCRSEYVLSRSCVTSISCNGYCYSCETTCAFSKNNIRRAQPHLVTVKCLLTSAVSAAAILTEVFFHASNMSFTCILSLLCMVSTQERGPSSGLGLSQHHDLWVSVSN